MTYRQVETKLHKPNKCLTKVNNKYIGKENVCGLLVYKKIAYTYDKNFRILGLAGIYS